MGAACLHPGTVAEVAAVGNAAGSVRRRGASLSKEIERAVGLRKEEEPNGTGEANRGGCCGH